MPGCPAIRSAQCFPPHIAEYFLIQAVRGACSRAVRPKWGGLICRSNSAYEEVCERVEQRMKLPPDVRVEYAGQFEREAATSSRLSWLGFVAVLAFC
jgi:hypothetical protein